MNTDKHGLFSKGSREGLLFLIILLVYFAVGTLFAVQTPDWQAPDEPPHYNYIAQVAEGGCCPVIEMGDWNQQYQNELTTAKFHPDLLDRLDTIQYEDHQPPFYYLLASVVFKLTDGSLIALRLFSVLIGGIVVSCAYAVGKEVLPERPGIALGAAALVAFLPQHVAILSAVNNDGLTEALIGITLLLTVRYLKGANIPVWRIGLLVGVGFMTKTPAYFLAGIVPLAIFLRWRRSAEPYPVLLRTWALFLVPALILGGIWWGRNLSVYGAPDFLGLGAHDTVVADQLRTAEKIEEIGFGQYLSEAVQTTFNSFWGQFGWMALPMPGWVYTVLKLFMLAVGVGLLIDIFVLRDPPPASPELRKGSQRDIWIVLALTLILAFLAYIYYNTEFLQFQGRYLFPGLIPFALWMAIGVDAWRRILAKVVGETLLRVFAYPYMTALAFLPLAVLDVYMLVRFIVPVLSP